MVDRLGCDRPCEHEQSPRCDPHVDEPIDGGASCRRVVRSVEAEHSVVECPDEARRAKAGGRIALDVERERRRLVPGQPARFLSR